MNIVPRVQTSLAAPAAARMLADALAGELGRRPTLAELEALLSLVWLETAGSSALWNGDWGNRSVAYFRDGQEVTQWDGDAWRPPWFDEPDASSSASHVKQHAEMLAGRIPSAFAAYASVDEGARAFARMVRTLFPSLLAAAASGNLATFGQAYRSSGYNSAVDAGTAAAAFRGQLAKLRAARAFAGISLTGDDARGVGELVIAIGLVVFGPEIFRALKELSA